MPYRRQGFKFCNTGMSLRICVVALFFLFLSGVVDERVVPWKVILLKATEIRRVGPRKGS